MNSKQKLRKIIAPLALGLGLTVGINIPVAAYPDNSTIYSDRNYHRRSFIEIQPFRSLNVTPRYHTPLPNSRYRSRRYNPHHNYNRYHDRDRYEGRQRRVHRRGFRTPSNRREDYYRGRNSDRYIRIRIR